MAYTTPPTFTAGNVLTAAELNTYVRDNFKALGDPWQAYTPAWTAATTNPAIGNGSLVGAYTQVGSLVHFRLVLTMGSTTTYGSGAYRFSLPVPSIGGFLFPFHVTSMQNDATGGRSIVAGHLVTTTTFAVFGEVQGNMASTVPWTWADGDKLSVMGTYEAA